MSNWVAISLSLLGRSYAFSLWNVPQKCRVAKQYRSLKHPDLNTEVNFFHPLLRAGLFQTQINNRLRGIGGT